MAARESSSIAHVDFLTVLALSRVEINQTCEGNKAVFNVPMEETRVGRRFHIMKPSRTPEAASRTYSYVTVILSMQPVSDPSGRIGWKPGEIQPPSEAKVTQKGREEGKQPRAG